MREARRTGSCRNLSPTRWVGPYSSGHVGPRHCSDLRGPAMASPRRPQAPRAVGSAHPLRGPGVRSTAARTRAREMPRRALSAGRAIARAMGLARRAQLAATRSQPLLPCRRPGARSRSLKTAGARTARSSRTRCHGGPVRGAEIATFPARKDRAHEVQVLRDRLFPFGGERSAARERVYG